MRTDITNLEKALEVLSDPTKKFVYRAYIGGSRIFLDENPYAEYVGFRTNTHFVWIALSDKNTVRLNDMTDKTTVALQHNDDLMCAFQREHDREMEKINPVI